MRKILLTILTISILYTSNAQPARGLDQHMVLQRCNITIDANAFVAKTFIELEFYNPQDREIEGLEYFKLSEGQVITGFQLELNGKFRDGSIEERWKANNAYNTIVGKRVDPALLQTFGGNSYKLNIYPFAPKSTRKVTISLSEILKNDEQGLLYDLPLVFSDTLKAINVRINVKGKFPLPVVIPGGFLSGTQFLSAGEGYTLSSAFENRMLKWPISFRIPQKGNDYHYQQSPGSDGRFALRLYSDLTEEYLVAQDSLSVYWDISASAIYRNLSKEISFLENYIVSKKISRFTLYLFNNRIQAIQNFDMSQQKLTEIRAYLSTIKYHGRSNINCIDPPLLKTDMALIFSDGFQTSGIRETKYPACQVNFVVSASVNNWSLLGEMADWNGGQVINLNNLSANNALAKTFKAKNMLFYINADSLNETLPIKSTRVLVAGKNNNNGLILKWGNNLTTNKLYQLQPNVSEDSTINTIAIIKMIMEYQQVRKYGQWEDILLFGLENKIVTERTAYIVLERVEDYINFKIAPPKELEEQCAQMNYVYTSVQRRQQLKAYSQQQESASLAANVHTKSVWWQQTVGAGKQATIPASPQPALAGRPSTDKPSSALATTQPSLIAHGENSMAEVVVTSAFGISRTARSTSSNVQFVNSDQLGVVRETNINNALAGKVAGLQVRSQSVGLLGAATTIRLRGENSLSSGGNALYVVNGTIVAEAGDVNPDDIDHLNVLQAPAATALFGPDGRNGAIVITLKKARQYYYRNGERKLANLPDVDYLQEIRKTPRAALPAVYEILKKEYLVDPAFYFDMADYFYKQNFKQHAFAMLEDGIDICNGRESASVAAAYLLESWGEYSRAIELYREILRNNQQDLTLIRDLALAYFQNNQFQLALNTYSNGLLLSSTDSKNPKIKNLMLNELNALVNVHRNELNLDSVDKDFIRYFPADLYISLSGNLDGFTDFNIKTPDHYLISSPYWTTHSSKINFYSGSTEYFIYQGIKGKYKISAYIYGRYQPAPAYLRMVAFKNYQRQGQSIQIDLIQIDNQNDELEIAELNWQGK
ncbi:MAG: hypothetical protein EOO13_09950 [Chitinophagaceae bacterium]|nr:MAG: hypothetical protein EOO13_09950 [Chitinophagaceae bacterium]